MEENNICEYEKEKKLNDLQREIYINKIYGESSSINDVIDVLKEE